MPETSLVAPCDFKFRPTKKKTAVEAVKGLQRLRLGVIRVRLQLTVFCFSQVPGVYVLIGANFIYSVKVNLGIIRRGMILSVMPIQVFFRSKSNHTIGM